MPNDNSGIVADDIDVDAHINDYIKDLKRDDIVVDGLEAALELAEQYKASGKYDWFRGQTGLWPLIPSAIRQSGLHPFLGHSKNQVFSVLAFTHF